MKDIREIKDLFLARFTGECALYAAPGRVNLIGEHTDYNEGFVLPGAIDKYMYACISLNEGDKVQLYASDYDEEVTFALQGEMPDVHWAKYVYGVVQELQLAGAALTGFQAVIHSDIPVGSGLSSSAALESVFAFALNDMFKLGFDKMQLARIGQLAEHKYAGVKCGIMDQFASLHGEEDMLLRLDCRSLEYDRIPFRLDEYEVVLIDTGVKHNLAASEYNLRRQQCEAGVSIMAEVYPEIKSLRDADMLLLNEFVSKMDAEVFRRCKYVIRENVRLHAACEALFDKDMVTFGEMMFGSHEGLRHNYEVSCQELDFLVDFARAYRGVIGARMMGGGFGGCTINLVHRDWAEEFIERISDTYEAVYMIKPNVYPVVISKGAHRIA